MLDAQLPLPHGTPVHQRRQHSRRCGSVVGVAPWLRGPTHQEVPSIPGQDSRPGGMQEGPVDVKQIPAAHMLSAGTEAKAASWALERAQSSVDAQKEFTEVQYLHSQPKLLKN